MSLKKIENIKLEYRTLHDDVVNSFYIPCLEKALVYKRAVGFFSSSVLVQITKGLASMARRNARIKLLISPRLEQEDYDAIKQGYDERRIVTNYLLENFTDFTLEDERCRFSLLKYLISHDLLDIRIAILQKHNHRAMYHEKMGIMIDEEGDMISFTGSNNETYNGYNLNYESIDVYKSWDSETDYGRCVLKNSRFDNLWNGDEDSVITIELPEVVREKIMAYETKEDEFLFSLDEDFKKSVTKERINSGEPSLLNVKLHKYQEIAIENWKDNNFKGVFDMATGSGKTFTGIGATCKLFDIKKRLFVVICCPYTHLIEQWSEELKIFNIESLKCYGSKAGYSEKIRSLTINFRRRMIDFACIVTTNITFTSDGIQKMIEENLENTLLIVDEAHNFGTKRLLSHLELDYPYRLALSATMNRHNDEEGTSKLYDFFGKKCITYPLEQAIIEGNLTNYNYYPVLVSLESDELEEYLELSSQISRLSFKRTTDGKISKAMKILLLKRSRVIAGSRKKIEGLFEIISGNCEYYSNKRDFTTENNMLIYCGAVDYDDEGTSEEDGHANMRQIDLVSQKLRENLGMRVKQFTSKEKSKERTLIKEDFVSGQIQALVAIKCLDEGVNIPAIRTAFILASSTNPKEYIQRRGRVLRKCEGKKVADIFDFVSISRALNTTDLASKESRKAEVALIKRELERVREFGKLALNSSLSNKVIDRVMQAYRLDSIEGEGDIYE